MSEFLLDTDVVSELRKGSRADPGVIDFVDRHPADSFWLSVIVIGELHRGIELLRRRDPGAAELLEPWFLELVEQYEERILSVSTAVALRWGRLGIPDPLPVADALVAATGRTRFGRGRAPRRRYRSCESVDAGHVDRSGLVSVTTV